MLPKDFGEECWVFSTAIFYFWVCGTLLAEGYVAIGDVLVIVVVECGCADVLILRFTNKEEVFVLDMCE